VNGVPNFLAVNRCFLWGNHAEPYLVAADFYHRDGDVVVDDDFFPDLP
jgi:hypothetical protein